MMTGWAFLMPLRWTTVLTFMVLVAAPATTTATTTAIFSGAATHAKATTTTSSKTSLSKVTAENLATKQRLNHKEQLELSEVSNSEEAIKMREYKLRNKKMKGIFRKSRSASLADVLFPSVSPDEYLGPEPIAVYADLVESRKNPIPYDFYDLPYCDEPKETKFRKIRRERINIGSRLQGRDLKLAPFKFNTKMNKGCTLQCAASMDTKTTTWMRKLIKAQYRVHLILDRLPVLMRSKDFNYAIRGYPIGFQAPETFKALITGEYYHFNHMKFTVTYHENPMEYTGVRITGFDVHPMSFQHDPIPDGDIDETTKTDTCDGTNSVPTDPTRYVKLKQSGTQPLSVLYSYEVEWVQSDLPWADRWDVYLLSAPDDDLHYFSIVNPLMFVLFLMGAIATIMICILRKDISVCNKMDGWKLVHGDVFRSPQTMPMALSVLIGTGAQICTAFGLAMVAAILKMLNPLQKGQTLTCLLVLYVLCGFVAGYVSSRIYKFMDQKSWKLNIFVTATALPGFFVTLFVILNICLSFAGAATAASFFTIVKLFLLWICISTPTVIIGGSLGLKAQKIGVPTKTNQFARVVPNVPWPIRPQYTIPMGGILPFNSVCVELAFIMSALWLHQMYYVWMGFLVAALLILIATCAQVSIVLTYLQLCAEDHRWWWTSFLQCASAGGYLFLYSIWFLSSRMEMVGILPVVIYLTYMGMISICFGLVCGSVGFLSAFYFTRIIYAAVKVECTELDECGS
jgi:transmembrane 9 superfamily member 2/4